MKNVMDYETIDWEAEALRVARAFYVEAECEFRLIHHGWGEAKVLRPSHGKGRTQSQGLRLTAHYDARARQFRLQGTKKSQKLWIIINWEGGLLIPPPPYDYQTTMILAKGFFHLDLLTPEAEAAMKLNITAHEKLEWTREYEERYGL